MLSRMLEDHEGNLSSMRIVWSFSVLTIILTWTYVSISSGTLQNFTTGDAAWFAALFGGKVAQSYVERQGSTTKNDIQTTSQIPTQDGEDEY